MRSIFSKLPTDEPHEGHFVSLKSNSSDKASSWTPSTWLYMFPNVRITLKTKQTNSVKQWQIVPLWVGKTEEIKTKNFNYVQVTYPGKLDIITHHIHLLASNRYEAALSQIRPLEHPTWCPQDVSGSPSIQPGSFSWPTCVSSTGDDFWLPLNMTATQLH